MFEDDVMRKKIFLLIEFSNNGDGFLTQNYHKQI